MTAQINTHASGGATSPTAVASYVSKAGCRTALTCSTFGPAIAFTLARVGPLGSLDGSVRQPSSKVPSAVPQGARYSHASAAIKDRPHATDAPLTGRVTG